MKHVTIKQVVHAAIYTVGLDQDDFREMTSLRNDRKNINGTNDEEALARRNLAIGLVYDLCELSVRQLAGLLRMPEATVGQIVKAFGHLPEDQRDELTAVTAAHALGANHILLGDSNYRPVIVVDRAELLPRSQARAKLVRQDLIDGYSPKEAAARNKFSLSATYRINHNLKLGGVLK